jgi:hypothetical protein
MSAFNKIGLFAIYRFLNGFLGNCIARSNTVTGINKKPSPQKAGKAKKGKIYEIN